MKNLVDYLNESKTENMASKIKEVEAIVKKMNIGDFNCKCVWNGCNFELGRNYSWGFKLSWGDKFSFQSLPSYGSFDAFDDTCKFYKSVGLILSQEKELEAIRKILVEIKKIKETE